MELERIPYIFSERETELQQITESNKRVVEEYAIDLDENHIATKCFLMVADAPPGQPAQASPDEIIAQVDERLLEKEYELLLLKEGL